MAIQIASLGRDEG